MRKRALGILAIVSVLIVVIAAGGYWFMVSFARTSVPKVYVPSQASFGGGRIFIYIDQADQISASRWVCGTEVGHEIVRRGARHVNGGRCAAGRGRGGGTISRRRGSSGMIGAIRGHSPFR